MKLILAIIFISFLSQPLYAEVSESDALITYESIIFSVEKLKIKGVKVGMDNKEIFIALTLPVTKQEFLNQLKNDVSFQDFSVFNAL